MSRKNRNRGKDAEAIAAEESQVLPQGDATVSDIADTVPQTSAAPTDAPAGSEDEGPETVESPTTEITDAMPADDNAFAYGVEENALPDTETPAEAPDDNDLTPDMQEISPAADDLAERSPDFPSEESQESDTDDNPAVTDEAQAFDNETPAPANAGGKKGGGGKKPLSPKAKKTIVISVTAFLLVVAITLSIALPIYFHFKDMIMVGSAEDFNNVDKGKYFVLKNDVIIDGDLDMSARKNFSIDLGKYTLTINGTLKYSTDAQLDINLGAIKKKEYVAGGKIVADQIYINAPNANVRLLATSQSDKTEIRAGNLTLGSASAYESVYLNAPVVALTGNLSTPEGKAVTVENCGALTVSGSAETTLSLLDTSAVIQGAATVTALTLNENSTAQVYGKITGFIEGGAKVAMLEGHACGEYRNIAILAIYREKDAEYTVKNCAKTLYIEKLPAPLSLVVEERSDGSITAVASQVHNAVNYVFTVDGETHEVAAHTLDITALMKNGGAGKHEITVYAKGNYSFETLDTATDTLYMNSDAASTQFAYTIVLDTPANLLVAEENDRTYLTFDKVNYAGYYVVNINGTEHRFDATAEARQRFDISDYVSAVGAYAIQVSAHSEIAEINAGKAALYGFNQIAALDNVGELTAVEKDGKIVVSWTKTETQKSFIVYVDGVIAGRTTTANFSFDREEYPDATTVKVIAEGYGYYTDSSESTAAITAAEA